MMSGNIEAAASAGVQPLGPISPLAQQEMMWEMVAYLDFSGSFTAGLFSLNAVATTPRMTVETDTPKGASSRRNVSDMTVNAALDDAYTPDFQKSGSLHTNDVTS